MQTKFCTNIAQFYVARNAPVYADATNRADALTVSVQPECASEKTTPQSASLTAPLTQGSQGVQTNICTNIAQFYVAQNAPVYAGVSIPGKRNKRMGTVLKRL